MRELVYLSFSYNDASDEVKAYRFKTASSYAASLMRDGIYVLCGISHNVPLMHEGLPKDWPHWFDYDRVLIERCNKVIVPKIDGWDRSDGVRKEIEIAFVKSFDAVSAQCCFELYERSKKKLSHCYTGKNNTFRSDQIETLTTLTRHFS